MGHTRNIKETKALRSRTLYLKWRPVTIIEVHDENVTKVSRASVNEGFHFLYFSKNFVFFDF